MREGGGEASVMKDEGGGAVPMDDHTVPGTGRPPQKYLFCARLGHGTATFADMHAASDQQLERSGWMRSTGGIAWRGGAGERSSCRSPGPADPGRPAGVDTGHRVLSVCYADQFHSVLATAPRLQHQADIRGVVLVLEAGLEAGAVPRL